MVASARNPYTSAVSDAVMGTLAIQEKPASMAKIHKLGRAADPISGMSMARSVATRPPINTR